MTFLQLIFLKQQSLLVREKTIVECKHCDFKIVKIDDLKKHVKLEHEGVKQRCEFCDHFRDLRGALSMHVKVLHKKIMNQCKLCDFESPRKNAISAHVKQRDIIADKYFLIWFWLVIAEIIWLKAISRALCEPTI